MPIPENAEQVRILCRRCLREHFVYVVQATGQVLAYDGSGTLALPGESLPAAFSRLLNAPCDECRRIRDRDRDFFSRRLADTAGELNRETDADPPPADCNRPPWQAKRDEPRSPHRCIRVVAQPLPPGPY